MFTESPLSPGIWNASCENGGGGPTCVWGGRNSDAAAESPTPDPLTPRPMCMVEPVGESVVPLAKVEAEPPPPGTNGAAEGFGVKVDAVADSLDVSLGTGDNVVDSAAAGVEAAAVVELGAETRELLGTVFGCSTGTVSGVAAGGAAGSA